MDHASPPLTGHQPPPPASPLSVEAEASLMNRGRGRQVFGLAAGAILLVAAGVVLLVRMTRGDDYAEAAAAVAQIERDHFDAFTSCALPGARRSQLDARGVHSAFESLGDKLGKSYGKTLARCLPHVQALTASVQALRVPAAVKPQRAKLVTAANALAAANARYLQYLSDGAADYEFVAAMPFLEKIGIAWAGYGIAQGDLKRALEERL